MGRTRILAARTLAALLAASIIAIVPVAGAGAAQDGARVRFMHAVPGVGAATLKVGDQTVGDADFAQATGFVSVPAGSADLTLDAPDGVTLKGSGDLAAGKSYTIIALAKGKSATLEVYADGVAKEKVARLRMIHASPELGEPDVALGDRQLASSAMYTTATKYGTVAPGDYPFSVTDPKSGKAVIASDPISLPAGTASTAVLVGSGGEQERVVLLADDSVGPTTAPQAGFGGSAREDSGPPWLLALGAAMLAGVLGGAAHRLAAGRGRARPRVGSR